jgi:Ca2+-binding EF-hand superfamily protein
MRHSLKLSSKYDPQGWFNACDTQLDGFMDADDIRNLFSKLGGIRESDIQILVDRYDTKAERDGQISFSEFLSQLRGRLTA